MSIKSWLNEVESYSTRAERLEEFLTLYVNLSAHIMARAWIEAAYEAGFENSTHVLIDDLK